MSATTGNYAMNADRVGEMPMHRGVLSNDANVSPAPFNVLTCHDHSDDGIDGIVSGRKIVDNFDGPMTPAEAGQSGQDLSAPGNGTGTGPGAGSNPLARPFAPSEDGSWQGVRSPQVFMDHFRALQAAKAAANAVRIVIPYRRILFKNVPEWMTLSDILCLAYGGPVDRAWKVTETEFMVQFYDDKTCAKYFDNHSAGIRVGDDGHHLISIEKPDGTDRIDDEMQEKIVQGGASRLVRISGVTPNKNFQALRDLVAEYEIDHILWLDTVNQTPVGYAFFANLAHAWEFKRKLEADLTWDSCEVTYMPDPCQVASGFHTNTIPCAMSSAAVNAAF